MKNSISILTAIFIWLTANCNIFAQREIGEGIELDFGFGNSFQITNLHSGKYDVFYKNNNYLSFNASINVPLVKKWQIWSTFSYIRNNKSANNQTLIDAVRDIGGYNPDKYYIESFRRNFNTKIFELSTGIAHKFVLNRWSIEPRLGFGIHIFSTDNYEYTAKEMGGYQIYDNSISFDSGEDILYRPHITFGANVNYYLFHNKLFVGASINYLQSLVRFDLKHSKRTWWGDEKTYETYSQKGNLFSTLNLSARIGIVL